MNHPHKLNCIIIGCTLFITLSCSTQTKKNVEMNEINIKIANEKYEEDKKIFFIPKSIFNHFPSSIENLPVRFYVEREDNSLIQSVIMCSYKNDNIITDKLRLALDETGVKKYSSIDTNLYVIKKTCNYEDIQANILKKKIAIPYFEKENLIVDDLKPINEIFPMDNKNGLSSKFDIYIIDSKSKYTKDNNIVPVIDSLPKTHRDGFSRGICINSSEGIIIYWTVIF